MKKLLSIVLSFVMTLTAVSGPVATASAATGKDSLTATRGVYWFDPHEVGTDLTDTYIYDDSLLTGDSLKYNQKLATMSYELAIASISSEREPRTPEGYKNKSRNLKAYLEDNGFVDFDTNRYYKEKMTTETMGAACAHKTITDGGKTYTLLAIVPRSAGYEAEWGGNFQMGATGDHEGFRKGKEKVLAFAKEYVEKYGITGDIKVWTAGYSRGAGVTNQVGAALIKDPKKELGDSIELKPSDLYCYTYGTPNSAASPEGESGVPTDSKFAYVHNTWEGYDIVTIAPPQGLGFARYGTSTGYAKAENKERMLAFMKGTNSKVYDLYTNGGDPDKFATKTIDIEKLIKGKEFALKDDENSYIPSDQKEFLSMMSDSIIQATGTRQNFYDNYQPAFSHLTGYIFSHMGDLGKVMDGVKENRFSKALVAMLYVSYMLDRYSETYFDEQTIAEIEKALSLLDEIVEIYNEAGVEIPEELEEYVKELRKQLKVANRWKDASDLSWNITGILYSNVLKSGLTNAGYDKEDPEKFAELINKDEGRAVSRLIAYMLLYDINQTDKIISFTEVVQQMKHLATFAGNASSFMRPHNNEVILSWLRTIDPSYDDFKKENAAQISGYRRLYIDKPDGVTVKGTVKDASGKTVATFKNGKITSRKDKWIGITTSDKGNWLRVPADKTYKVVLSTSKDTKLNLKASEYDVYSGKVVRTVKKDSKYKWTGLKVKKTDKVTWVISKVAAKNYKMPSKAKYYIKIAHKKKNILVAKGISKGSSKIQISWNKISGAEKYAIYFSKCNYDDVEVTPKKVKTVSSKTLKWTKTGLKKNCCYKYYVAALKKVDGKYKAMAKSFQGHTIAGDVNGNFANPKSLSVKPSKITLKVGKTKTIKASAKPVKAGKKFINHTPHYRFRSDCKDVATVSAKGKVKAKAIGTAKIYVQAENGMWKVVKVTVK